MNINVPIYAQYVEDSTVCIQFGMETYSQWSNFDGLISDLKIACKI